MLSLSLAPTAFAQVGAGDELQLDGADGPEEEGEYQLRGPEDVTSPDEFLRNLESTDEPEDQDEPEDEPETAPEETVPEVSLELDLEEGDEEEGELPPVHPVEPEQEERLRWLLIPPYYQGIRGEAGTRLFFPFFFQRWTLEGRRDLLVFPFYWRSRGPAEGQGSDVAFPLVWSFRNPERRTWVIGNVYWSRGEEANHTGIAPLLFWGETEGGLSYQVGFPLYWRFMQEDGTGFTLASLWFDHQMDGEEYRRGVFPFVWIGERQGRGYALGLPLFYHFWNRPEGSTTTVVPPVYVRQYADGYGFGIAPLLFVRRQEESSSVTMLPLFHYRWNNEGRRTLVTPLAWFHRRPGTTMGGALLYHFTRRPHSRFDGFIPFYLRGSNSNEGSRWQYIAPFIYTSSDPVRRRSVFFPVVWDFDNRHRSRTTVVLPLMVHHRRYDERRHTTWVAPTFQYSVRPDGFSFNIHPLVYTSRSGDDSHQVVAPLFFRFNRPDSTSTVFFPFYWDFIRGDSRTSVFFPFVFRGTSPDRQWTAVLNTVYISGERNGVPYWSFNFFPFFRIGRPAPGDIDWQVLLGLFGYGRRGSRRWLDLFWVPVELDNDAAAISSRD